jgi:hypothetical protein
MIHHAKRLASLQQTRGKLPILHPVARPISAGIPRALPVPFFRLTSGEQLLPAI